MSFVDPFTNREISERTFDDRVVEYQLERETLADRLDYAVGRLDDANTARSQDYWSGQIETLRDELTRYDDALGSMAEQSADAEPDRDDYDVAGDYDVEFAGDDADSLADYADDMPDDWDDYGDEAGEWEFGVDYEGEE
jgi:hypothetical protein